MNKKISLSICLEIKKGSSFTKMRIRNILNVLRIFQYTSINKIEIILCVPNKYNRIIALFSKRLTLIYKINIIFVTPKDSFFNHASSIATCEYIWFIQDLVLPVALEKIVNALESNELDLIVLSKATILSNLSIELKQPIGIDFLGLDLKLALNNLVKTGDYFCTTGFIFRTEVINKCPTPSWNVYPHVEILLDLLDNSNTRIGYLDSKVLILEFYTNLFSFFEKDHKYLALASISYLLKKTYKFIYYI